MMSSGFPPAHTHTHTPITTLLTQEAVSHVTCGGSTSDLQAIVTGVLGEGRHVGGVLGQDVGLLGDAERRLLDALVVAPLKFGEEASEPAQPLHPRMAAPPTFSFFSSCRIMWSGMLSKRPSVAVTMMSPSWTSKEELSATSGLQRATECETERALN